MLRIAPLALASLLATGAFAGIQNGNKAMVALFQTRYDGITRAYLKQDVAAAATYISDDYMSGNPPRGMTKQKTLDALKNWKGHFKTTSRKVLSVIVNGKKATVMVDNVTEGNGVDKNGTHKYVIKTRSLDTWVHNPAGWQVQHAHVIQKSTLKDGKVVPPRNPGG